MLWKMYFVISAVLNTVLLISGNTLMQPKESEEHLLHSCIREILRTNYVLEKGVVFTNIKSTLGIPLITLPNSQSKSETFTNPKQKTQLYILKIPQNEALEETFYSLKKLPGWNNRANFLVEYSGNLTQLFERASKIFIYNIAVLQSFNIYTYFPFKNSNVVDVNVIPELINTCVDGKLLQASRIFPEKLPKTWNNSTLKLALVYVPPYINCLDCFARGLELEIFDIIRSVLKFDVLYLPGFDNWGQKTEGNYDNAFGALQKHEAHAGLGMFQTEDNSIKDFDMSIPYILDHLVFVVPRKLVLIEELMLGVYVWAAICASYILISFIWYAVSFKANESSFNNLGFIFLTSFRVLLNSSLKKLPRKCHGRAIFLLWCFSSWILMIDIQSYLMYFLTHDRHEKEIDSIQSLARSDLQVGLYIHLQDTFLNSENEAEQAIHKKHVHCNVDELCMNRSAYQKDIAIVRPRRTIKYEISCRFLDKNGDALLQPIDESIVMRYVNMCFPRGFPMFPKINELLLRIQSSGFVEHWNKWYLNYANSVFNENVRKTVHFNSKALNMRHLRGVFNLLFYGLAVAFICFLLEILMKFKMVYLKKKKAFFV